MRVPRNEQRPAIERLPVEKGAGHHSVVLRSSLHLNDAHVIILVVPAVAHEYVPVPAQHSCHPVAVGNAGSHVFEVNEELDHLVLSHLEPCAPHQHQLEVLASVGLNLNALLHVKVLVGAIERAPFVLHIHIFFDSLHVRSLYIKLQPNFPRPRHPQGAERIKFAQP